MNNLKQLAIAVLIAGTTLFVQANPVVRIAELQIKPAYLNTMNQNTGKPDNNIDISVDTEPGVLAMFYVTHKDNPTNVQLMEIYADDRAYASHIGSDHYKRYAAQAKDALASRILLDTVPVQLSNKPIANFSTGNMPLVRIAKLTIAPEYLNEYTAAVREEIQASVKNEAGVIAIFAVAEKDAPNKLHLFEFYANKSAYQAHLKSPHFLKYSQVATFTVKDKILIETIPLKLRAKPDFQM